MSQHTVVRSPNATPHEIPSDGKVFSPRVDIVETAGELLLLADLPGVRPGDIDLRYERGELILHGKIAPSTPPGQPILQEYDSGDFFRVFQIHESVDASKIEAEFKNGVLTVRLAKQESVKPRQVQIRAS